MTKQRKDNNKTNRKISLLANKAGNHTATKSWHQNIPRNLRHSLQDQLSKRMAINKSTHDGLIHDSLMMVGAPSGGHTTVNNNLAAIVSFEMLLAADNIIQSRMQALASVKKRMSRKRVPNKKILGNSASSTVVGVCHHLIPPDERTMRNEDVEPTAFASVDDSHPIQTKPKNRNHQSSLGDHNKPCLKGIGFSSGAIDHTCRPIPPPPRLPQVPIGFAFPP